MNAHCKKCAGAGECDVPENVCPLTASPYCKGFTSILTGIAQKDKYCDMCNNCRDGTPTPLLTRIPASVWSNFPAYCAANEPMLHVIRARDIAVHYTKRTPELI